MQTENRALHLALKDHSPTQSLHSTALCYDYFTIEAMICKLLDQATNIFEEVCHKDFDNEVREGLFRDALMTDKGL